MQLCLPSIVRINRYKAKVTSVTPQAWSQQIVVDWRLGLRFFNERLAILNKLSEAGILFGFQYSDEHIAAKVFDDHHDIILTADSGVFRLLTPTPIWDRYQSVLGDVIGMLTPSNVVISELRAQFVTPLSGDYAELRRATASSLLRDSADSGHVTDWAVLVDGESSHLDAVFSVEFGIVDGAELPDRLTRMRGRMARGQTPDTPDHWLGLSLPTVALFCDFAWQTEFALASDADMASDFGKLRTDVLSEGATFIESLLETLTTSSASEVSPT